MKHRKQIKHFNNPGEAHFLTFSCINRRPLLRKEFTIELLLHALAEACRKWNFDLWGYVIMPEHVHLIVWPRDEKYDMAKFLQAVKQPVSRNVKKWLVENNPASIEKLCFECRDGRKRFHFWLAGGGYDRNLYSEKSARKTIEYIHYNPVRRGLVEDPFQWKWSSATWWRDVGRFGIDLDTLG